VAWKKMQTSETGTEKTTNLLCPNTTRLAIHNKKIGFFLAYLIVSSPTHGKAGYMSKTMTTIIM
jgi:hypothetical protein